MRCWYLARARSVPLDMRMKAITQNANCHSLFTPLTTMRPIIYGEATEAICPSRRLKDATDEV